MFSLAQTGKIADADTAGGFQFPDFQLLLFCEIVDIINEAILIIPHERHLLLRLYGHYTVNLALGQQHDKKKK